MTSEIALFFGPQIRKPLPEKSWVGMHQTCYFHTWYSIDFSIYWIWSNFQFCLLLCYLSFSLSESHSSRDPHNSTKPWLRLHATEKRTKIYLDLKELSNTLNDFERRIDGSISSALKYDFSAKSNWFIAKNASPWQIWPWKM